MNSEQDYLKDLTEIRSMMERSTKFLSLSGWAGVLAGVYALAGAYIAGVFFSFRPDTLSYPINPCGDNVAGLPPVLGLAFLVLALAVGTAVVLSAEKGRKHGSSAWNPTSRRMVIHMSWPLFGGGFLILILLGEGMAGLAMPLTLIFYGLSLINASMFTYREVRSFGWLLMLLGLLSVVFIEYSIWLWAAGFGVMHIIYGIFLHIRYER